MKTFGLVGWSGSGKTTLLVKLIPELIGRGLRVSTIKHTHHRFDIDKPGKDSYEHRAAGAHEVLLTGSERWSLLHENRGHEEPGMEELIARMEEVDLILIEGFKSHNHKKMEVYRPSIEKPLLAAEDSSVVAIASDETVTGADVPVLDLDDVPAIADYIVEHCGLTARIQNGAA